MHIGFINQPFDPVLPPHQNSIGIWTYQTATHLPPEDIVSVYAKRMNNQSHASPVPPEAQGVSFNFVRAAPNRLWEKFEQTLGGKQDAQRPLFAAGYYYGDYAANVALKMRRAGVDVAHIHNFSQFVPAVRRLYPQAKIVLHMHGEWLSQLDPAWIEPRIRQADAVVGVSDYLTDKVRRRFPQLAQRCHTIYNGVNPALFTPEDGTEPEDGAENRLLFVGRISPEKGVHTLLDAFTLVAQDDPDVVLDIVGPFGTAPFHFLVGPSADPEVRALAEFYQGGDYRSHLLARIPSAIRDRVHFPGSVPQKHLPARYRQATVLINPSLSESFGMSLIEAMACGRPVIATRAGGMTEVVQEEGTGLLVDRNRPEELAAAIRCLLADPERRAAMGIAGRQQVLERYSWQAIANSSRQLYQTLLTIDP